MKKKNERCPLQIECERVCQYSNKERQCDYYQANSRPGFEIEDQEIKTITIVMPPEEEKTEPHNNIVYIPIEKLHPHRNNPRKNIGELTELAESIKAQGILQNLTVVPVERGFCPNCTKMNRATFNCTLGHKGVSGLHENDIPCPDWDGMYEYTVVIGHRRLAAAELAGLAEVPCIISDMNHREQVATMLSENIQRSDLTVYEQAQGFQMMMDLGDTTKEIAERTGFSSTTVRRRIKLLELDKEKFKKSEARGATLFEYAELEQIEDLDLRNKVLDSIGTANFKYELQRAIDKEKTEKAIAEAVEKLETFAVKVEDSQGLIFARQYYGDAMSDFEIPEDAGEIKYFYKIESWGFTLYKEREDEDQAATKARDILMERRAALREITERAYNLRRNFIKGISNATAKKYMPIILNYGLPQMIGAHTYFDEDGIFELLDVKRNDDENYDLSTKEIILKDIPSRPYKYMLEMIYSVCDNTFEDYYNWNCEHEKNEDLSLLYDFLICLDYEMSDEEKAMQNGTHELFNTEEGE